MRVFGYESEEKRGLVKVDIGKRVGMISKLSGGFGFVHGDEQQIFFHHSDSKEFTLAELGVGDNVVFAVAESPKGQIAPGVQRV